MKSMIPSRSRSFFDPALPRCAANAKLAPLALRQLPLRALRCGGRGPRKNIYSRIRNLLFLTRKGFEGKVARTLAGLVLLLSLLTVRPAPAATELHGADSSFRAQGITILWAILKSSSEENTSVHIRILHDTAASTTLTLFGVEAVDPFSKEREWVVKGVSLRALQTLKIVRTDFRDKTERWLHFYTDQEALEKSRPALTIFYHGVPDTAPELLSEVDLEAYLAQALLRIK
jgi:hypothetical protein